MGLLVHGRHVRGGAGVEDQQRRGMVTDDVLGEHLIGGIGGERHRALTQVVAHGRQLPFGTRQTHDTVTRSGGRGTDRTPEISAATGATAVCTAPDFEHSRMMDDSVGYPDQPPDGKASPRLPPGD
ncbi:hypothetical protein ACWDBW_45745 [Streptomyces sp. NPDC001107]